MRVYNNTIGVIYSSEVEFDPKYHVILLVSPLIYAQLSNWLFLTDFLLPKTHLKYFIYMFMWR